MPTGSLPSEGKKIWEKVYKDAKAAGDDEEKAAKKAWGAVRQAGWSKDEEGKWKKKADVVEFSLAIKKASFDPKTGERRWKADCSDTELDSYNDKMSMELFADFCGRIQENEQAPEEFRSEFWSGGMPYLSVSHYPDLDGKAVPGNVEAVYIDGNAFKSRGTFNETPLGLSAYETVKKDLLEKSSNPVRISIAFLDYKHRHLSNGFVFERSLDDPDAMVWCPECLKEHLTGKYGGKEFLRGQLIHLAMTRVPVNKRTLMEVERSEMTTRKEDAASIIGEELANELDEKAKLVGKSEALVIKADEEVVEQEELIEETGEALATDIFEVEERPNEVLAALAELKAEFHDFVSIFRAKMDKEGKKDEEDMEEDEEGKDKKKKKDEEKSDVVELLEAEPAFTLEQLSDAVKSGMLSGNADVVQRLDILISAWSQNVAPNGVPQRRSLTPPPNYAPPVAPQRDPTKPMTISEMVHKSVMGQ